MSGCDYVSCLWFCFRFLGGFKEAQSYADFDCFLTYGRKDAELSFVYLGIHVADIFVYFKLTQKMFCVYVIFARS